MLEPDDGVDDHVEILVLGPARRAHDEADRLGVHAEPREQRLPVPLAIAALDRARTADAGRSYSTCALVTPNRLSRNAARPRDTHRFASTRRASRRSSHRASRMAGCQWPRRRRSSVYPRLCQSMKNRTPLAAQRPPGDRERRERRRVLDEDQVGTRQPPQRPPQAKAQAGRIEQAGDRIARSVQAPPNPQTRALDADAR